MASPELYGRVAIITGTTRGIGLATAKAFLREGARVVGCAPAADDVPPSLPEGYVHHACDVSNPQQVEDLVAVTVGAFGRIDCLVNNAGVHPLQRPIDDFDVAEFNAVLAEFHQALNPGGILIIDHRNFDSIRQHRYQSSGNYYYCGTGATVTVAHVDSQLCRFQYDFPDGGRHQLEVYPVLSAELSSLLIGAGFDTDQTFGDFRENFDIDEVDFVIHVARKS